MNQGSSLPLAPGGPAQPRNPFDPRDLRPGVLLTFEQPVPYVDAWAYQKRLHEERGGDRQPDHLLLLQHHPVYTMGRTTKPEHWRGCDEILRQFHATLEPVDRGGSITYHGPGQLVGYPIMKLAQVCPGPKAYVRMLESVLIEVLALWGIEGYRLDKKPGVWVRNGGEEAKIALIGVRIERGVTMHGFALNVDLDLAPFCSIIPCGLAGCRMTSMAESCRKPVSCSDVAPQIAGRFADLFGLQWTETTFAENGRPSHHQDLFRRTQPSS